MESIMEISLVQVIAIVLPTIIGMVGLFGWSHKRLSSKIDELESFLIRAPNEKQVRIMIDDQLRPMKVEYDSLTRRIDEIRQSQMLLYQKLDHMLELLHDSRKNR